MKAFKSYTCLKIQVDGQPDVGYKRLIKGFFFKKKKGKLGCRRILLTLISIYKA